MWGVRLGEKAAADGRGRGSMAGAKVRARDRGEVGGRGHAHGMWIAMMGGSGARKEADAAGDGRRTSRVVAGDNMKAALARAAACEGCWLRWRERATARPATLTASEPAAGAEIFGRVGAQRRRAWAGRRWGVGATGPWVGRG